MKNQYAKEYGVKLYNQGFYKFGPMEQCDSGEWVRWADIEPFLQAAELRVQTAMETEREAIEISELDRKNADGWKELYRGEAKFNKTILRFNKMWVGLTITATIIAGVLASQLAFGGA
jgi:hypothetical protein